MLTHRRVFLGSVLAFTVIWKLSTTLGMMPSSATNMGGMETALLSSSGVQLVMQSDGGCRAKRMNGTARPDTARIAASCDPVPSGTQRAPTRPQSPSNQPTTEHQCTAEGHTFDCTSTLGEWSPSRGCFVRLSAESAAGNGVVSCRPLSCLGASEPTLVAFQGLACLAASQYWRRTPGAPDPEEVARSVVEQVVAEMMLGTPAFDTAPTSLDIDPHSRSLVGLPIWMWLTDRTLASESGRVTARTVADGGLSLTVTATLDAVEYVVTRLDAGSDAPAGTVSHRFTCRGDAAAGTAFDADSALQNSPTCGIRGEDNDRVGTYDIRAEATYRIAYTTTVGISGEFPHTSEPRHATVRVGELQVLVTE